MLYRLRREVPDKTFIPGPTEACACADYRSMKPISLPPSKSPKTCAPGPSSLCGGCSNGADNSLPKVHNLAG
jgi:hypothetical protein